MGRREERLKQYFHRGYHQIRQGTVYTKLYTCTAKQAIAKRVLGHSHLVPKNTGAQLFSAKKYWGTAI